MVNQVEVAVQVPTRPGAGGRVGRPTKVRIGARTCGSASLAVGRCRERVIAWPRSCWSEPAGGTRDGRSHLVRSRVASELHVGTDRVGRLRLLDLEADAEVTLVIAWEQVATAVIIPTLSAQHQPPGMYT